MPLTLVTHDGTFHADETMAISILNLALYPDFPFVVRSRDPKTVDAADIVVDVGGVYNFGARRFDHHFNGSPLRNDSSPYAAAGLVWKHYHERAIHTVTHRIDKDLVLGPQSLTQVFSIVDAELVSQLDQVDTGFRTSLGSELSAIVRDLNATPLVDKEANVRERFEDAIRLCEGVLIRKIERIVADVLGKAIVETAETEESGEILILDNFVPWTRFVSDEVKLVVFFNDRSWKVQGNNMNLPVSWRGLVDQELSLQVGVEGLTFCHPTGFILGASTKQAATEAARKALPELEQA